MRRAQLVHVFEQALRELDLASRVAGALPRGWADDVGANGPAGAPIRIVAIGKGAPAMAAGAVAHCGAAVERCLVVAPDETDTRALERAARAARLGDRLVVLRAAHPLPDARSVRAANACLALVATEELRRILVLVSGGASSLVCAPAPGITLREKRAVTRDLLRSGASIQAVNAARKRLSRIKGGGLARAAGKNALVTLVASDVIGGSASDVGSGPTIRDKRDLVRSRTRIIVSPEELARTFVRRLRAAHPEAKVHLLHPSQAPVDDLAAEYAARIRSADRCVHVYVRAAEPSVVVEAATGGRGGRSTHLAALVARASSQLRRAFTFAALATDGIDGTSDTAGAIIDDRFATSAAHSLGPTSLAQALDRFDTGPLHHALATAVPSHPTGHNLADLHVLVVEPPEEKRTSVT